jgi:hypothetical protein
MLRGVATRKKTCFTESCEFGFARAGIQAALEQTRVLCRLIDPEILAEEIDRIAVLPEKVSWVRLRDSSLYFKANEARNEIVFLYALLFSITIMRLDPDSLEIGIFKDAFCAIRGIVEKR